MCICIFIIYRMSGGSPNNGKADSYDDMTPIPVISYSTTNNALAINNPMQTTEDIAVDGSIIKISLHDQLDSKAPLNDLTFTGIVLGISKEVVNLANVDDTSDLAKPISTATRTALDLKADKTNTYTKADVDTKIANLVNSATALDTLEDLAQALDNDANFSSTIINSIAT